MAQMTITVVAIGAAALLILLLSAGAAAAVGDPTGPALVPIGMPNCVTSCGGVDVPYPFGIGMDARCYLPEFNLTCDTTTGSQPRLLLDVNGTLQFLSIHEVSYPRLKVQHNGDVKINVDADGNGNGTFSRGLKRDGPYTLTGFLELILTGCNVQATVKRGNITAASCTSLCEDAAADDDGTRSVTDPCFGGSKGCCRENIVTPSYHDDGSISTPGGYDVQLISLHGRNHSAELPVRVFVAYRGWFDNSSVYTDLLRTGGRPPSKETMAVPVWLSWDIVGHPSNGVCRSNHSERRNGARRGGYICSCSQGYDCNPYLANGCKDINECENPSQEESRCYGECINTEGSFMCRCQPGTTGNYSIPGGCVNDTILADTGSCMRWCGDVEVPYPFGIGPSKCYMPGFDLMCDMTHKPPRLLLGSGQFRVVNISLLNTTVHVIQMADLKSNTFLRAHDVPQILDQFPSFFNQVAPYSLSTINELILTGCNVQATMFGHGNPAIISGCASFCSNNDTTTTTRSGAVGWPTNGVHLFSLGDGNKPFKGRSIITGVVSGAASYFWYSLHTLFPTNLSIRGHKC